MAAADKPSFRAGMGPCPYISNLTPPSPGRSRTTPTPETTAPHHRWASASFKAVLTFAMLCEAEGTDHACHGPYITNHRRWYRATNSADALTQQPPEYLPLYQFPHVCNYNRKQMMCH